MDLTIVFAVINVLLGIITFGGIITCCCYITDEYTEYTDKQKYKEELQVLLFVFVVLVSLILIDIYFMIGAILLPLELLLFLYITGNIAIPIIKKSIKNHWEKYGSKTI